MALQAGMGVSRLVLIIGTGSVGTALYRNGKLSDVLGELQKLLSNDKSDDVKSQLQRVSEELKRASQSHPIIINGSSSGVDVSSLLMPAAAVGALGYGYMWWKGISFSDLMYVTTRGMATAVENLTKHLELVSVKLDEFLLGLKTKFSSRITYGCSALESDSFYASAAKKHLTQRIGNVESKVDEQGEISKLIRSDVNDVRGDISLINVDLDGLQKLVSGLDDRLLTMEEKQEIGNLGVYYLCGVANGQRVKMPEKLQEHLKGAGKSAHCLPGLVGLKDMMDYENDTNRLITNGDSRGGMEKANDLKPRSGTRLAGC